MTAKKAAPRGKTPNVPAKANGKAAQPSLPKSIVNSLPTSVAVMKNMTAIEALIPQIAKELEASKKAGAIQLARSFVVLHRMMGRIDEILNPLNGKEGLFNRYKTLEVPTAMEQAGITNVPLDEGFRVGMSARIFASILSGETEAQTKAIRDKALQWLRENGLADLIQATVNSGTLSATARDLMERENRELPDDLFKTVLVPTTSVTKTK